MIETGFVAPIGEETHAPISWSAILAGAAVALGASVVVAGVASGVGFKTAGAWGAVGMTPAVFTPTAGAALVLAQVLCFALGGYLAGRLRVKWANVHTHEVFFRDTAHGLLAWAVATIAGADPGRELEQWRGSAHAGDAPSAARSGHRRRDCLFRSLRPGVGRLHGGRGRRARRAAPR